MIIWTPTVLNVLYACVSYFCIWTYSAQLSMFHMEKRSRSTLIIIIIIIINEALHRTTKTYNRDCAQHVNGAQHRH